MDLRPEGAEVRADARLSAGEETARTLANPLGLTEQPSTSDARGSLGAATARQKTGKKKRGPRPARTGKYEITRSTSKLAFEPWRLATDKKLHADRDCGGWDAGCKACGLTDALYDMRGQAVTAANTIMRAYWRADGQALDEWMMAHPGERIRASEWKMPDVKGYKLAGLVAPRLCAASQSIVARMCFQRWTKDRWDALVKQVKAPSHFKNTLPIPLRAAELQLRQLSSDRFELTFPLLAKGDPSQKPCRWTVPIVARDGFQRKQLAEIASGNWKIGNAFVQQDRLRKARWYLRISYKRPVVAVERDPMREAAINRGMLCFFTAVTTSGRSIIYDADDIEAHLQRIKAQRRRHQRQVKMSSRIGHGKVRTLQPIERLQAKGERWRETKNQTLARRLSLWMQKEGITHVYLEDFTGIRDAPPEKLEGGKWIWDRIQEWPYYQFQMRLQSCLEEIGIGVTVLPPEWISQRCPECTYIHQDNRDLRHHKLRCVACPFVRHLDVAAAMNLLWKARERRREEEERAKNSAALAGAAAPTGETARKATGNHAKGKGTNGATRKP